MAERDILAEAMQWYESTTRLVPAEAWDRMGKPQALYVGYLLGVVQGLRLRCDALALLHYGSSQPTSGDRDG
jgi:hypothetical protein